jgi:SH3 domain protein
MKTIFRVVMACVLLSAPTVHAASAWVTDQFEITLRSGPSTSNAITRMLDSGTELEVIERDRDSGYSRVRTAGGTEGWVLTRYLMDEPSAREQLEKLTSQLTNASTRGTTLESQLAAVQLEYRTAEQTIETLEREKASVERELAEIRRTAANVLAINDQNQSLMDQLSASQLRADTLEQENRNLSRQSTRYWFMTGALVLLVGIILGIWLPRIRWQRRSRYDRF